MSENLIYFFGAIGILVVALLAVVHIIAFWSVVNMVRDLHDKLEEMEKEDKTT